MLSTIRNFVIIAHIDHGKSTLADRFLEITGTVDKRQMKPQYLDQLESERERGITIKMAPVRMTYKNHILNLIDTPGHSDFTYEVSRALEAVEGAILLVDATQGIQAQTLSNFRLAKKAGLKIIGAVNKIDLVDEATVLKTAKELGDLISCGPEEIYKISGKTGKGAEELLDGVIKYVPPPQASSNSKQNQALIFDSLYDDHKGVIPFVRVFSGEYKSGIETKLVASGDKFKIKEVGYFSPKLKVSEKLTDGEIGYIATGIKDSDKLRIGDTVGDLALPGYQEPRPVIFVSLYPDDADEYDDLKQSLMKLKLNDSSLTFEPDFNEVLGRGFKAGFLGQLHFEITAERLEKEFEIRTISTFPSVSYRVKKNLESDFEIIRNLENLPDDFAEVWEPMIKIEIMSKQKYFGDILKLKEIFLMEDIKMDNFEDKILITADMPLSSLVSDFDSQLKSISEGMASFNYEISDYKKADLKKVEILVAGEKVPGLTRLIYKERIDSESRQMLEKLKELLPKQQFAQALQARSGGKIVARENIPAMRKDVTGYLYGGDRTRKMKLWKKQKRGKERLKASGRVTLSAEIFKELLKK